MLTTEDGDLEVQLSSKSQPERAEKKKVTFQFLEDADEDVDFAEEPDLISAAGWAPSPLAQFQLRFLC